MLGHRLNLKGCHGYAREKTTKASTRASRRYKGLIASAPSDLGEC